MCIRDSGTFISGFEPLAGLISGDPSAWTRFFAQQTDMLTPYKGVRSVLNNLISPQLKDVENDYFAYLKNANKFIFGSTLKDHLDIYTGKPVNTVHPINVAANAVLPVFKSNGGMEPWRQWLLATGWDGVQRIRRNKYTQEPLSSDDRHFLNNWIAKNANLEQQITHLMIQDDGYYTKKMKEYKDERGLLPDSNIPIRKWVVHQELDRIHDRAFDAAWTALEARKSQFTEVGRELSNRNLELQQGNIKEAKKTQQRVRQLLQDTRNK